METEKEMGRRHPSAPDQRGNKAMHSRVDTLVVIDVDEVIVVGVDTLELEEVEVELLELRWQKILLCMCK